MVQREAIVPERQVPRTAGANAAQSLLGRVAVHQREAYARQRERAVAQQRQIASEHREAVVCRCRSRSEVSVASRRGEMRRE